MTTKLTFELNDDDVTALEKARDVLVTIKDFAGDSKNGFIYDEDDYQITSYDELETTVNFLDRFFTKVEYRVE